MIRIFAGAFRRAPAYRLFIFQGWVRSMKLHGAQLRRRQVVVLWCGVALSFFTSMSKLLVPGPIVGDLKALGLDVYAADKPDEAK